MSSPLTPCRVVRIGNDVQIHIKGVEGVTAYQVFREEDPGGTYTLLPAPTFDLSLRRWVVTDATPGRVYRITYTDAAQRDVWVFTPPTIVKTVVFGHIHGLEKLDERSRLVDVSPVAAHAHIAGLRGVLKPNSSTATTTFRVRADADGFWQTELPVGSTVHIRVVGEVRTIIVPAADGPVNWLDVPPLLSYPHGRKG